MAAKRKTAEKITRPKPPKASRKSSADEIELAAARKTIKKLKSTVVALEKRAAKLEKKADELKAELKRLRVGTAEQVKKGGSATVKQVKKAKAAKKIAHVLVDHDEPKPVDATPVEDAAADAEIVVADVVAPADGVAAATDVVPVADVPASELTVAQLREAARAEGVAGYSRMRKEQLISALS
jgi:predicted RNase H-like nuclease (RuvC/YqgF family)